jgi:hypothetical protein
LDRYSLKEDTRVIRFSGLLGLDNGTTEEPSAYGLQEFYLYSLSVLREQNSDSAFVTTADDCRQWSCLTASMAAISIIFEKARLTPTDKEKLVHEVELLHKPLQVSPLVV